MCALTTRPSHQPPSVIFSSPSGVEYMCSCSLQTFSLFPKTTRGKTQTETPNPLMLSFPSCSLFLLFFLPVGEHRQNLPRSSSVGVGKTLSQGSAEFLSSKAKQLVQVGAKKADIEWELLGTGGRKLDPQRPSPLPSQRSVYYTHRLALGFQAELSATI